MIILGTNSVKDTGFDVANSVRLDNNAYLNRTFSETGAGGGGGTFKWTLSLWFKRSLIDGNEHVLMSRYVNANKYVTIKINGNNKIEYRVYNSANQCRMTTTAVFRDVAAWTHFVIAQDSTLSTAGDRVKFFINGSRVTVFDTQTNFNQNVGGDFNTASPHHIGAFNGGDEFQGYFAQICFVDNVQYDADQFGEFDEDSGIWKPKDVSGLSSGATSFFLDFADSGDLGDDESGESNDFTENNLTAIDQSTDTCTNNFCTWNPLDNFYAESTFQEGNLEVRGKSPGVIYSYETYNTATIGVSSGKWFWEAKLTAKDSGSPEIGIVDGGPTASTQQLRARTYGWSYRGAGGVDNNGSTVSGTFASYTTGDIIGIALNLNDNELTFYKNGAVQNSGTALSITAPGSTTSGFYFPAGGDDNAGNVTWQANFGSPPFAISSGNADGNNYGNFEYAVPSGYYALNTKNLSEFG